MINYFKAAERLLAQRGNLEQALENLGRRRELASTQAKAERDNIKPRPYASSGGINAHTSARLELAEINREIVATRSTIAEIDRVFAQLDDADAELSAPGISSTRVKSRSRTSSRIAPRRRSMISGIRPSRPLRFCTMGRGLSPPFSRARKIEKSLYGQDRALVLRW